MDKIAKCKRCSHEWRQKIENPAVCPGCKSPYWNKEYTNTVFKPKKKKLEALIKFLEDSAYDLRHHNNTAWVIAPNNSTDPLKDKLGSGHTIYDALVAAFGQL